MPAEHLTRGSYPPGQCSRSCSSPPRSGASNLAASTAIGLAGVNHQLRIKIAVAFGTFEAGMPLLGMLLGRQAAGAIGSHANLLAGGLLAATGAFTILTSRNNNEQPDQAVPGQSFSRLLVSGAALSIDNLVVGFALGSYRVNLALAAIIIAAVSVAMSLAGLELGQRLGGRVEHDSTLLSGAVLIAAGAAIATELL
jgi:putative Mn2+ efflux pump MntP